MSAKALGQRQNSWTSMWKSREVTVAKPSTVQKGQEVRADRQAGAQS